MYNGVTNHKNTLGSVCLVIGLGFLWRFLVHYRSKTEPNRGRHLLADCAVLAIVIWLLWRANSVTSSACFLIAATVMIVTRVSVPSRMYWVVHLLVLMLVGLATFSVYSGELLQAVGRNANLTGRTDMWKDIIDMATDPFFGTGFESFWLGDRLERMWSSYIGIQYNQAHNGYLEVYLNLGLCGMFLLCVMIVAGYRTVVRGLRSDCDLGALKLAYLVTALVYNNSEAGFKMLSSVWIYFLLAVIAVPGGVRPERSVAQNLKAHSPKFVREQAGIA